MSVLAAVLAATRSMIPAPENELREPTQCMKEVIAHTHYHPQRWRRRGYGSLDVREEFLGLYPYIIESFFSEMLAIAFTPLALFFTLPRVRSSTACTRSRSLPLPHPDARALWQCADRIIDYVRDNTTTVEGVGDVLSFSRFDLVAAATSADMAQVPPEEGAPLPAGDNASRGLEKVQQSLLSFIVRALPASISLPPFAPTPNSHTQPWCTPAGPAPYVGRGRGGQALPQSLLALRAPLAPPRAAGEGSRRSRCGRGGWRRWVNGGAPRGG